MKNLCHSMHPCIRAPGSRDSNRLPGYSCHRFLYDILKSLPAALALPATVRRTIIRAGEKNTSHTEGEKSRSSVLQKLRQ